MHIYVSLKLHKLSINPHAFLKLQFLNFWLILTRQVFEFWLATGIIEFYNNSIMVNIMEVVRAIGLYID